MLKSELWLNIVDQSMTVVHDLILFTYRLREKYNFCVLPISIKHFCQSILILFLNPLIFLMSVVLKLGVVTLLRSRQTSKKGRQILKLRIILIIRPKNKQFYKVLCIKEGRKMSQCCQSFLTIAGVASKKCLRTPALRISAWETLF